MKFFRYTIYIRIGACYMLSISWILSEIEDAYIKVSQRELSAEETPFN